MTTKNIKYNSLSSQNRGMHQASFYTWGYTISVCTPLVIHFQSAE